MPTAFRLYRLYYFSDLLRRRWRRNIINQNHIIAIEVLAHLVALRFAVLGVVEVVVGDVVDGQLELALALADFEVDPLDY